ncbi:MAG TPA: tRNA (adenosine(37)-N6)-threonylcarbamoyltransferase complex ATPase subunit type 1 TsaE [Deltaproteobacteria bacterium]|nr:tRNA (adenosine(37)-N6)-threonylcarbamoyltransferase complex ATPase subunit type 1 TsaE [Deltaproteobacteria bacterium]
MGVNKKGKIALISQSAQETMEVARKLARKLTQGDIVALSGELGSGKTCFTAGLARGLGVSKDYQITSPTFTLINEYPGRCKLYHFDVYRLNCYSEFDDLGYEEYFNAPGIVVVEWAEKVQNIIPSTAFFIKIKYIDDHRRDIEIQGMKDRLRDLAKDLNTEVT